MKLKIFLAVLWTIIWALLTEFVFMPTLAFAASSGIYWTVCIYFLVLGFIFLIESEYENSNLRLHVFSFIAAAFSFVLMLCISIFGTWGFFHSNEYQQLVGTIKETEFTSNIQPIAPNQMIIVDQEIARRIGEKELGSIPGLGSRAVLGDFTLQAVKGQLYWIAPLEHTDFFKWNRFSNEGTPGYVRVSATNQEDYALVTKLGTRDLHIKYQTGSCFGQDLERHIYTSGYRSDLFTEYNFEVDDEWNPYWTITLYDSKVGFSGRDAYAVLTVNPETGEIKKYSISDAPVWVERIQPENFVRDQVDDWGHYVHGYWNWSGTDIKRAAKESSLVLGSDGKSYFYFGLTSNGNDNSTIGFVMVDTRTKVAHWFKQAGATENAARASAEGKVQEKGYVGSDGITYNINGQPTYEFLLKDKAGLMKLVALVNVHDHTVVGIGEDRQEAIRDYLAHLSNHGNSAVSSTSEMEIEKLNSTVQRFASEIVKGNTYYYLILNEKPNLLFTIGSSVSTEVPLTREGDIVSVTYVKSSANEISVRTFDNLAIRTKKDSVQINNQMSTDSLRNQHVQQKADAVIDNKWENLSSEEKRKLLKNK